MEPAALALTTPLRQAPGITPRAAGALEALGLTNVGRLIAHLPLRHQRIEPETPIAQLVPDSIVRVRGLITDTRPHPRPGKPRFHALLTDDTGRLELVWFNAPWIARKVHPGDTVVVQGKTARHRAGLRMVNPLLEHVQDDEPPDTQPRIQPVYPASESVRSSLVERAVRAVLPHALPLIEDHLPPDFRAARDLPSLADAYRMLHDPHDEDEIAAARRRLAYDELLMLQLGVQMKRAQLRLGSHAPQLRWDEHIDARIRARFPFQLTSGQEAAVADIVRDLASSTPTNRLIQGDVGSGKTVVALYAMLMAVATGHQAALMAPTELLAEQHCSTISRLLDASRVRIELLTGSLPQEQRDSIRTRLEHGQIDILIGTHALVSEPVRFRSLALVVIDEQHRFGVHHRAMLRRKGATGEHTTPHTLVMTATPIPRSIALTLFGDLDITTIEGLPPGRRPVRTRLASPDDRARVYHEARRRINRGEQVYVVVPAIDSPDAGMRDVRSLLRELEEGPLAGLRLAALHGRLKRATRDAVMERFRAGRIHALVATTVIEVGVDVPNATMIIIEHAERFGLAQLHQLRGRVGRGDKESLCVLIADPQTPDARQRIDALLSTTDGFVLAQKDLEIRGPGEFFGTRQSGAPPLRVADLASDLDLLRMAARDAIEWIARSPRLDRPDERLIRRRIHKAFGETLGLVEVG